MPLRRNRGLSYRCQAGRDTAGYEGPVGYAGIFVRQALELSGLERPLAVCCAERPAWLRAVAVAPGVALTSLPEALALYAPR